MNPGARGTSTGDARPRGRFAGHSALVGVQLCFGLFPVFGKIAMDPRVGFDPLGIASWRILAGSLVLALIAAVRFKARCIPPREEWGLLLACALLGIVVNQGLFLMGLQRSTATNAGLVMCLIPVFTFIIAAFAGHETFRWIRALGVLCALAGIAPLFLGRGANFFGEHGLGNSLMALNCLSYSAFLVVSKGLSTRYPALLVMAWIYLFSLPFLPVFMARARMLPVDMESPSVWASLAYILTFATLVGYLLNAFALARVRASTTAIYVYMQPVITGLAGYLILAEKIPPGMLRGAAMLFVGIALVSRRGPSS